MSAAISDNPFCRSTRFAGKRLHLGVCGSVACYKACDLLRGLLGLDLHVSATLSDGARKFMTPLLLRSLGAETVHEDMFAGNDVFGHLAPRHNADCMAFVPASANMLAKLANGFASDMLSAQFLAFSGPVVIAPAMNPGMWANAATRANVELLAARGALIVEPGEGATACGEEGRGRLAALAEIFLTCLKALAPQDMAGQKIMLTLGPTREPWDGARFWSNPSSGRMGVALATAAWLRGARVTAVCGPGVAAFLPGEIRRVNVETAKDMNMAARDLWPEMTAGVFCAAVADFAPKPAGINLKVKKGDIPQSFALEFARNPDILASLAAEKKPFQKVMGFAAEITPDMETLLPLARAKLERKHADIIAANRVNRGDGAFGSAAGSMAVVDRVGTEKIWPQMSKADIAWDLLTWLLQI